MKAQELRYLNIVSYNEEKRKVHSINPNCLYLEFHGGYEIVSYNDVHPLKITPELLEKAGFEIESKYLERYLLNGNIRYSFIDSSLTVIGAQYYEVKYFHHLQNLIFDLTGEEIGI